MRILDAQLAALDTQDPIAGIAKLEDVARQALNREILVHAADRDRLGFDHNGIVGGIRNRASRGQGSQPRIASALDLAVHGIAMQIARARSTTRCETLGEHAHDIIELLARKIAIRPGPTQPVKQRAFVPFPASDFCDDLLGQHIDRRDRDLQRIQFAATNAIEQGCTFHKVIA